MAPAGNTPPGWLRRSTDGPYFPTPDLVPVTAGGMSLPNPRPSPDPTGYVTPVVGPESRFSPEEPARADTTVRLGARVLGVGTAAVVAPGLVLGHPGEMNT